jgi:uncharacterized protein YbjT (DUF2867 family)
VKILLPGGSGQVGTILARALHGDGHEVVVLSRSPAPAPWRTVAWDGESAGDWVAELDGADAVINLAGPSVGAATPLPTAVPCVTYARGAERPRDCYSLELPGSSRSSWTPQPRR